MQSFRTVGGVRLYFEIIEKNRFDTPIYELINCEENNNIFIKRDDLSPFSFGGNKARKDVLFRNEIKEYHADYIVTYGIHPPITVELLLI